MEKRRSGLWLLVLFCLLAVGFWIFLFKDALFSSPNSFDQVVMTELPALTLYDEAGEERSLREFLKQRLEAQPKTQHVLLSFWATWCAPCVDELPLLEAKSKEYLEGGLDIVLLNFDTALRAEDRTRVLEWKTKYAPSLQGLFDPRDQLLQALALSALPFNAVVSRDLRWVWGNYGVVDFNKIESEFIVRSQK